MIKIALLTTDSREHCRDYDKDRPSFGTAPEALLQGFAVIPDIIVHVVSCTQQPMESPETLASNIYFHSLHVPKIGWLRTGYQGCIRAVRRKLHELQPDIVHGQGTERECAISAVFSGFPNVLTVHGNMRLISRINRARPLSYGWLAARLEGLTIPRSNGVVCITRYTRDAVQDLARRTWLAPNAVDQSFFALSPAPVAPPEIVVIGHIIPRKNQNRFIQALDGLAAEQSFKVVFFGMASKADSYANEFFRLLKTRPWCEYRGMASRTELRLAFSKAALMVLPSLEDNCPMTVLEAMAAGVPVLAARVGGVPELIEDGQTGLLCDPLEAASLASGVKRLLADAPLATRIAAKAKVAALQQFHPQVIARRHVEIYKEVLSLQPTVAGKTR
jgi:glycosyltransferase involved in cell wall biosynthesis